MSEELTRAKEIDDAVKAADAKKRQDAEEAAMAGAKLDRILDCMDALGKRHGLV
jgi:ribosome assembly protein YihI (activator of Der GTPase)